MRNFNKRTFLRMIADYKFKVNQKESVFIQKVFFKLGVGWYFPYDMNIRDTTNYLSIKRDFMTDRLTLNQFLTEDDYLRSSGDEISIKEIVEMLRRFNRLKNILADFEK